ncbi:MULTISPECIES: hypothetical protein [Prauserella salsuginis group]|uniref:Uncharacterized protein n=1 Tax=Prauserella salsuginis TaxID=387889 RepID=A0ABW6G2Q4_9PSEU|nr:MULTISPECIES: hypothetical protein [Prauserella salsuginis group]MCR3719765.1 hypothetical protein [Prauserella flava]MCR3736692.1 hypothetical protein [Prauserella salsuginis]
MTLENHLRRIAFGDPGESTATPDHRIAGTASGARTDRECWLAAVVLGARGRYAAATTLLRRLRHSRDVVIASLAASTIASHRRQLGGHAAALPADGAALAAVAGLPLVPAAGESVAGVDADSADRNAADGDATGRNTAGRKAAGRKAAGRTAGRNAVAGQGPATGTDAVGIAADADGVDVAGAWADALLGLAADQLALGRPALARRLVGEVTAGLDAAFGNGGGSVRSRVRAAWVGAEAALAGGDPATAVASAEAALHLLRSGSRATPVRHRAKTELVLAAALLAAGSDPARAAELVASALTVIDAHGFVSLSWPARLLAAETDPAGADEHRRRATREVHALLPRVDPELRRLAVESPWVPA